MAMTRDRPPFEADERTQLVGWLDLQRALVPWKCEGLTDEEAHRVVLDTSPLMTVAGLVSHLRWTEYTWFETLFLDGSPEGNLQFVDAPEDADMRVEGRSLADLVAEYEQQCARSNEIVAAHSLDDRGRWSGGHESGTATLRWMLIHMVEETGRHVGHLDIIRELLDGRRGYY